MDFRPLFADLFSWRSKRTAPSLYHEFLLPWVDANTEHITWLKSFSGRNGSPTPSARVDDLWDLYSISRLNELLLTVFQAAPAGPFTKRQKALWVSDAQFYAREIEKWNLTLEQYVDFMTALGFRVRNETAFTPVLHEIVEVTQSADSHLPIQSIGEYWPALMLGDMVFSRAGVLVEGGSDYVVKDIAEHSPMFWAWLRRNRQAVDLSKGWGSNSQWRTDFRRDYILADQAYLNVDARPRSPGPDNELTEEQRREVLLHRCLIKSVVNHPEDLWPYDLSATIPFP
jgi:hypothetical protein